MNASLPETQHVVWRIGINLGEVVVEGDDLFGDGVNVAARLQALVEPGGICISGKVRDEVDRKISAGFDDMGEQCSRTWPRRCDFIVCGVGHRHRVLRLAGQSRTSSDASTGDSGSGTDGSQIATSDDTTA